MAGIKTEAVIKVDKLRKNSEDCGLGHACSFCPREQDCTLDKPMHNRLLVEKRLHGMGMALLVMANKGGVGKSTVAANLAISLTLSGYQVGLADADIHGPNAPRIFGLQDARVKVATEGIETPVYELPETNNGLKLGSLGFFLSETDTPVVWRDAYKHDYIHHMIGSFNWGALDFLVVDMPPGTGNELITLTDLLEGSNLRAILVSTADAIALQDTLKAARFCRERGVPVLGLVENYCGTVCPHCDADIEMFPRSKEIERFEEASIPTIARLPFSGRIASGAEAGRPAAVDRQSPIGRIFEQLAVTCAERTREDNRALLGNELSRLLDYDDEPEGLSSGMEAEVRQILHKEKERLAGRGSKTKFHE